MELANNSLILRTLAKQPGKDKDAKPRERLWNALLQIRERAEVLANEIHRDLPDFTDHGLTHLDALWEMAALIAGPGYPLNPLEAFVLGGVFLIHDLGLGLAAWPGGPDEIKKGAGWGDALSTLLRKRLERIPTLEELENPPADIEKAAIQERLRMLHAEHAERLALASFPANPQTGDTVYYLIEDADLRQQLGSLFGKIAHSHWWPVSRLANEFGTTRGALPNCPGDWTIDPLKIAVLLRTADAAHLDAHRAPGFLLALRRPEGISRDHWSFQNHLLKPQVEDDRLVYTTNRPFLLEEVDAWWLCEETLRMVDRELHKVDALLADRGRPRLQVRGVAKVESPQRLKEDIEVDGWTPVDARLHVSNVADLARKLGGEQLYGEDPTVPLRELIQNAADAVRSRRLLEDHPGNWGKVTVRLGRDEQGPWAEVEDTGIGMSEEVLTGPLLDFGTTYWGSTLMREEHEGLWAKGFDPTGRFGIGFFSVFMWGNRVQVSTRRYKEDAQKDTRILEFWTGIDARPLVRLAKPEEQLQSGGTRIRVWLQKEPNEKGGLLHPVGHRPQASRPITLRKLCEWLAPALDIDLYVDDGSGCFLSVSASDWLTIGGEEFLARLTLDPLVSEQRDLGKFLRVFRDSGGRILGRAAVCQIGSFELGVATVGGIRGAELRGIAGILISAAVRVSRDRAVPIAGKEFLESWASDQGKLLGEAGMSEYSLLYMAASILLYGGKTACLPVVMRGGDSVRYDNLADWESPPEEVAILSFPEFHRGVSLYAHVLEAPMSLPLPWLESSRSVLDVIIQSISLAWQCSPEDISAEQGVNYEIGVNERGEGVIAFITPTVLRRNSGKLLVESTD